MPVRRPPPYALPMKPDVDAMYQDLNSRVASQPLLADLNLPALVKPAVRLATRRSAVENGASRIGGLPDVPPGFEWPRWVRPKGGISKYLERLTGPMSTPLGFVAQLDLSAIPRVSEALPDSGWLYFFFDRSSEPWGFDPADRGACCVIYADCDRSALQRITPPKDVDADHLAECCAVDSSAILSLPSDLPSVKYGTSIYLALELLREGLLPTDRAAHQILGHPGLIQGPMELECQLASNGIYCGDSEGDASPQAKSLEPGAADWRLLLQIDTDEDGPGWMWGDCGRIYFWIREQDLRARRFEDVWLILQCS